MNILVVGCGSVGSRLASALSRMGHDVSVVDRDVESFEKLADDFTGITVVGVPIDQDVLRQAGIEGCDAMVAVTRADNVNLMVCQIAKEIFHVERVLARVYDANREEVFSSFGLNTVCPTNLTVDSIMATLTDRSNLRHMAFGSSTLSFTTMAVPRQYNGYKASAVQLDDPEATIIGILHGDDKVTLTAGISDFVVYETDRLILSKVVD